MLNLLVLWCFFQMQGGDPTGTGHGGESIWGKPFEDEFATVGVSRPCCFFFIEVLYRLACAYHNNVATNCYLLLFLILFLDSNTDSI